MKLQQFSSICRRQLRCIMPTQLMWRITQNVTYSPVVFRGSHHALSHISFRLLSITHQTSAPEVDKLMRTWYKWDDGITQIQWKTPSNCIDWRWGTHFSLTVWRSTAVTRVHGLPRRPKLTTYPMCGCWHRHLACAVYRHRPLHILIRRYQGFLVGQDEGKWRKWQINTALVFIICTTSPIAYHDAFCLHRLEGMAPTKLVDITFDLVVKT